MGMPNESEPLPVIFGDSLYAIAQISADVEVKSLATKIEKPREALTVLVAARTKADDRTVIAEAARDRAYDVMQTQVEILERKVSGVYADAPKKAEALFRGTTSKIFNSSVTTRNKELEDLAKSMGKPGLHADLKAAAKDYVDARTAWLAAVDAHEATQDAEADAIEAVTQGKRTVIAAMIEVHGLLRAKYSTNVKRAESYFRRRTKKVSKAAQAEASATKAGKVAAKAQADAEAKAAKAAKAAEKAKALRGGAAE